MHPRSTTYAYASAVGGFAIAVLVLLPVTRAQGQTAPQPSSPIASPTPISLPPAQTLLTGMFNNFASAGTVRVNFDNVYSSAKQGSVHDTGWTRLEYRHFPASLENYDDQVLTRPGGSHLHTWNSYVQVGARGAFRPNGKAWQCTSAKPFKQSSLRVFLFDGTVKNASTISAETVNGIAAWHVRVDVPKSVSWGDSFPGLPPVVEDMYISQSDDTMLRAEEHFTGYMPSASIATGIKGPAVVSVTSVGEFGAYGTPMQVALPAKCSGSSGHLTTTATDTPRPATPTPTATVMATLATSPTVSSTPSIQSGEHLLAQMRTAVSAKNSYHVSIHINGSDRSTERIAGAFQGDVSLNPQREQLAGSIQTTRLNVHPATTVTQRERVIVVGQREATRTDQQAWNCGSTNRITPDASVQNSSDIRVEFTYTLDPEIVATIPVWHVRQVDTSDMIGSSFPLIEDYYISQENFTLVRQAASISVVVSGITTAVTTVRDFTKYSDDVHVVLPAACKGKKIAALDTSRSRLARGGPSVLTGQLELQAWPLVRAAGGIVRESTGVTTARASTSRAVRKIISKEG